MPSDRERAEAIAYRWHTGDHAVQLATEIAREFAAIREAAAQVAEDKAPKLEGTADTYFEGQHWIAMCIAAAIRKGDANEKAT